LSASLLNEAAQWIWLPLVGLSAAWLFLIASTKTVKTTTNGGRPIDLATEAFRNSGAAIVAMAREPMGMAIFAVAFLFGLSDGATGIAFRPRLVSLGVDASWALGLVQGLLTASRLLGVTLYRGVSQANPARVGAAALAASSVFYFLYSTLDSPALAVTSWLLRVALLAGYFPLVRALASQTSLGKTQTAAALSSVSVVTLLGSLVFGVVVGALPSALAPSMTFQLKIGAFASLAAGLAFLLANKLPIHSGGST
jgi:hypothetical protein